MDKLKIIAFFDGIIGHEKQTKGILNALGKMIPIEIISQNLPVISVSFAIKNWIKYLTLNFKKNITIYQNINLIIGTGSYTHIPMLILKKKCDAKVITCMSPMSLLQRNIDICFIPWHDHPKQMENVFVTIGPPNTAIYKNTHKHNKGLILVGGIDKKSHIWKSDELLSQIDNIVKFSEHIDSWTISSSRRTPLQTIEHLKEFSSKSNIIFFEANQTPAGWIEKAYSVNETVWITADSISMVFEALTAGCAVGIMPVSWKNKKNKFKDSLEYLNKTSRVTLYEDFISGKKKLFKTKPLIEAQRCAEEILRRYL